MTIAVGVLANGGVVLAADTQLTITNFWKGKGGKIMATSRRKAARPSGVCAITGATTHYEYLHGLGDDITRDFLANIERADKAIAYDRFGVVLRRFYRRHIVPITVDQPAVDVLVAYQRGDETALWQSAKNKLIEQPEYGSVGIGAFAANAWLEKIWKGRLDMPTAIVSAVFAAAVAKESVDGCGKYTNVLIVEAEQFRRIPQDIVNEIDSLYEMLSSELQPNFVLECLGEEPGQRPLLSRDQFVSRITDIRQRLKDSTPDAVKQWRRRRYESLGAAQAPQSSTDADSGQLPSPE